MWKYMNISFTLKSCKVDNGYERIIIAYILYVYTHIFLHTEWITKKYVILSDASFCCWMKTNKRMISSFLDKKRIYNFFVYDGTQVSQISDHWNLFCILPLLSSWRLFNQPFTMSTNMTEYCMDAANAVTNDCALLETITAVSSSTSWWSS